MAENSFFPRWSLKTEGVIMPEERLPPGQTFVLGLQHVVAMFGATVLAPLLMGFDPNVSILFSGIATLIFFLVVGGIIAAGALYTLIGVVVAVAGHRWVERLMPPVVTGAIVAAIGLVLAPIAINAASGITPTNQAGDAFARWIAILTVVAVALVAVYAPGMWRRLPILLGAAIGYAAYLVLANGLGVGTPIDFSKVGAAAWFGLPNFTSPVFTPAAMSLIAPVAIILVAENLGHIKAIGAM